MKKYIIILIILFCPLIVNAKEEVKLSKCVDGDTATFIINGKKHTARFLAIDTPETKHPKKKTEPYGKEASNYTCTRLKNATKIEIEFDSNSTKTDKYDRYLVWVFVDNKLLQEELVENGLAKVAYLYGDYKYTNLLKEKELIAKNKKLNIWSDYEDNELSLLLDDLLELLYKKVLKYIKNML